MTKLDFIARQLAKAQNKRYEHYVVNRIWNLLNDSRVKFVTQQFVSRPEGRAMTDMFFPQLNIHIEVDEGFHKKQINADRLREEDIINATGHRILRVDVTKDLENINEEIDGIVTAIKTKIDSTENFEDWDMEAEMKSQTYIDKGYIDLNDNVAFRTMVDAANCFGLHIKQKGIWTGGAKHGVEPNTLIWFPKLYQNKDWNNQMSDDGELITEMSEDPASVRKHIDRVRKEEFFTRIVFPRFRGSLGDYLYRFAGRYELDNEATGYHTGLVWRRVATRVSTYDYKGEESDNQELCGLENRTTEASSRPIDFHSVNSIRVIWTDDGSSYVYETSPGSIKINDQLHSILFDLHEIDGQDNDLQVVIQPKTDGSYVFKTDYFDAPEHQYPLKRFSGKDELLFCFEGKEGTVYFHLKKLDPFDG